MRLSLDQNDNWREVNDKQKIVQAFYVSVLSVCVYFEQTFCPEDDEVARELRK